MLENETINHYMQELNGRFMLESSTGHIRYADDRSPVVPQMPFWLARHGETHINLRKDAEGWANSGMNDEFNILTSKGMQQARELAVRLYSELQKEIAADTPLVIVTSALSRARHTAQPFLNMLEDHGLHPEVRSDPGFNEIDLGIWNNKLLSEMPEESSRMKRFRLGADAALQPRNGESFLQLLVRAQTAIQECNRRHRQKAVVVFTHSTTISAIRMNKGDSEFAGDDEILRWTGKGLPHAGFIRLDPWQGYCQA